MESKRQNNSVSNRESSADDVAALIGRYQMAAVEHSLATQQIQSTGDRAAVSVANKYADEMLEIASAIAKIDSTAVESFSKLLDEHRHGISVWAAFHILEIMNTNPADVKHAFSVLESAAKREGIEALGIRMRLAELRRHFGQ